MDRAADPDLVRRFASAIDRLQSGGRLGLAVSGGPDSMAMLFLARQALTDFEVATVNHGLRPEAQEECALVERTCAELGVPCTVIDVSLDAGNLLQQARRARYAALGRWAEQRGLAAILTAHHVDDQAETLLMRLNRGSGLAGLAGIRESGMVEGCEVPVLRPLLAFRREELRQVVEGAGATFASDPSNSDLSFDRVQTRQALADAAWLDVDGLARSAGLLDEVRGMVEALAREDREGNTHAMDKGFAYAPYAASRARRVPIWIEIVRAIAADLGSDLARGEAAKIVEALLAGRKANVGGISARVEWAGGDERWLFEPEAPRRAG